MIVVEDNRSDVFLIREAIKTEHLDVELRVVVDGQDATLLFDALDRDPEAACPALVILDLNLPKKSGSAVLRHIRNSTKCRGARVLVVTSSDSPRDREAVRALGVNGYFCKPSDYAEFMKLGTVIKGLLAKTQ